MSGAQGMESERMGVGQEGWECVRKDGGMVRGMGVWWKGWRCGRRNRGALSRMGVSWEGWGQGRTNVGVAGGTKAGQIYKMR